MHSTTTTARSSSIHLVYPIKAGICFQPTEHLHVELRSLDRDELATLHSWLGQELDPIKASDLIPTPQSLAWRDIRRYQPHCGESYARQQTLYVHIHSSYESQANHFNTHEEVRQILFSWLNAVQAKRPEQPTVRGIPHERVRVSSIDVSAPAASRTFAAPTASRVATPQALRAGQRGSGLVSFLGMVAVMAFAVWQIAVILLGTTEVSRVRLGVVTNVVSGLPIGGGALAPVENNGAPGGRMFLMVQVDGNYYYPLMDPLVVQRDASLVLRTFRSGRRLICNDDASVCARTADAAQEISATRKASAP